MNSFTKQKQTYNHRKQSYVTREEEGGNILGVWDQQKQAIIYKRDN